MDPSSSRRLGILILVAAGAAAIAAGTGCSSSHQASAADPDAVRALIVGTGPGPDEPRHVADALMQYRLLRSRGLSDDEIVLALPAWAIGGPGGAPAARAEVGGPDLRAGAEVDLPTSELDPAAIARYLDGGDSSLQTYAFLSGHGDAAGLQLPEPSRPLTGADFASALESLRASHAGEVTLTAVIEDCQPDSFLDALGDEPGATVLTAAARGESSFATEYDRGSGTWLADQFTAELTRLVGEHQPADAQRLLELLSDSVPDSQPQLEGDSGGSLDELVPRR